MEVLKGLKPEKVFEYFERLCSVPHGSGNTKQISDLCKKMAEELGLKCRQDDTNNIVIFKEASKGYEDADTIILQGHIDMVCVKTETCGKDLAVDPIELETDGKNVWAKETSLGGDDGIAVAMAFAILADDTLEHPAIEAVFTVDEETGMDGARALDCSDLKGRKLLNIDSEEEGVFTVSCAGGMRADCFIPGEKSEAEGSFYSLVIDGLLGGHSGCDIDKGRGSANQLMGRVLYSALEKFPGLRLAAMKGGKFDNVICPKCEAVVCISKADEAEFEKFIREFDAALKNEYQGCDKGISLRFEKGKAEKAYDADSSSKMLHVLLAMPQGVMEMSSDFKGLVQTSLNMGILHTEDDGLYFGFSIRSSIATQKEMLLQRVRSIVEYNGGTVSTRGDYPGWEYARDSVLKTNAQKAFQKIYGREAEVTATHGGLECGLFISKIPGLEAISLGPDLKDIHSVNEIMDVASVERTYQLVREILKLSK